MECRRKKSVLYLPELAKDRQIDTVLLALNGQKCHRIGAYANEHYVPSKTRLQKELQPSGSLDPKLTKLATKMKSFHRREEILGRKYKQKRRTLELA